MKVICMYWFQTKQRKHLQNFEVAFIIKTSQHHLKKQYFSALNIALGNNHTQ